MIREWILLTDLEIERKTQERYRTEEFKGKDCLPLGQIAQREIEPDQPDVIVLKLGIERIEIRDQAKNTESRCNEERLSAARQWDTHVDSGIPGSHGAILGCRASRVSSERDTKDAVRSRLQTRVRSVFPTAKETKDGFGPHNAEAKWTDNRPLTFPDAGLPRTVHDESGSRSAPGEDRNQHPRSSENILH